MANPESDHQVFDLYCGVGTISLFIAPHVRRVVGVELVPEAVENARQNAEMNNVENCTFVCGDMLSVFSSALIKQYGKPDILIVDPPRAGMHAKVVHQIVHLRPDRLVYVSCNPRSQVRDIALLLQEYDITAVQPVDMFPHTHHTENVVCLQVKSG